MQDIKSVLELFYAKSNGLDKDAYEQWNLSAFGTFDEFYYDFKNMKVLYTSEEFTIG